MTPASQIIARLGGPKAVGEILGISRNAVQRWTYDPPQGLGDRVPQKHWMSLVANSGGNVTLDELMTEEVARIINAASKPKRRKAA